MKLKQHALTLGCLAAMGLATSAQAVEVAGAALEVYGNLYPQYQNTNMGSSFTAKDAAVSPMITGVIPAANSATGVGAAPTTKTNAIEKTQLNWVNSYIGFKGQKQFGDVTAGFDLQGVLAKNVEAGTGLLADTRDAFAYLSSKNLGTIRVGQMDTVYKEYGDRVRMLGISSSNFVSTSGIVSGVSWKQLTQTNGTVGGTTSFNTRIGGQVLYETPSWNGFQAAASYRADPAKTTTQNQSLTSMGVKWSSGPYYIGLGTETHNDYRAFSGSLPTGATVAATDIRNINPRSKDTATRLALGYKDGPLQLAADFSNLSYTEEATAIGKFSSYKTSAWQVSADYALGAAWNLAMNYASGGAGTCALNGGAACSTTGLGGTLLSLGAKYNYDKSIGVYAIYGLNSNNASSTFGSPTNAGGNVTNMAVGIHVKF